MSSPPPPPEIRRDVVFNRYIIFSPARSRRPSDLKSNTSSSTPTREPYSSSCPFCAGNERQCAPEIFRHSSSTTTSSWDIRVIENLYPALRRGIPPPPSSAPAPAPSPSSLPGFGFHDVVIETPLHSAHLPDLSASEIREVLLAYKERTLQLAQSGSVKYVQVFKNHGASAGASLSHSHSQIMGLPFVPSSVSVRLDSMKDWFERTGKCGLCEVRRDEVLVDETEDFFAVVPFAAAFPFEVWIVPSKHEAYFHEIDERKAMDLGGLLKLILSKLSRQLNDPPFNFMIHTAPFELEASHSPCTHWFLQIIPQLTVVGGFEMGSGCYINPVFPEDAAKVLREVKCPV